MIEETLQKKPAAKIISIGCGISEDVFKCLDMLQNSRAEVTLIDVDRDALNYSSNRLQAISERVHLMYGNIYRSIVQLPGNYDLILLGGVFDYISDQVIVSILARLIKRLSVDGQLFFTNIKAGNPYRIYLEYLSNWILIERSREDLYQLLSGVKAEGMSFKLELDESGMTYLVTVQQNCVDCGESISCATGANG